MHALTDPRLFLWMTQKNVYGKLKRNKIAVDVSHMSHSRTYTLDYPVKNGYQKEEKKNNIEETSRKTLLFFVLFITTSAELEYSATPLRNQYVPRSSFCMLSKNQSKKRQLILFPSMPTYNLETTKTILPLLQSLQS